MTNIALFHSVLGVRTGVLAAADLLRAHGHAVLVVDQYDGRVFDDYEEASSFAEGIGYPVLMQRALEGVRDVPDGFVAAGFSNGGGMAEHVATNRQVSGVLMFSGALPLEMIEVETWPAGVPAQIHYSRDDPFREQAWIDSVAQSVRDSGSTVEVFDYPGAGHLLTDVSRPGEFDAGATELLWERALELCARVEKDAGRGQL